MAPATLSKVTVMMHTTNKIIEIITPQRTLISETVIIPALASNI